MATETAANSSTIAIRVSEFASKVESLGVRVHHVADVTAAAAIVAEISGGLANTSAVLSAGLRQAAPGLTTALAAAGVVWAVPATPGDARDKPLGLSFAPFAVAETGSVLLAERTLADRSTGLITRTNLVISRSADLLASLDDAAPRLREIALRPGGGYAAFVTGPSRTADIEMSLTVGVQGPAELHVIFVDELDATS